MHFKNDCWTILNTIEKLIKNKIENAGILLKNWDIKINYGIKTGFNEAFIINEEKRKEILLKSPKAAEIIRPFNIIVPLVLIMTMKQKNSLTKQIISVQILWTIIAPIVFMLGIFLKFGHQFTLILMILIALSNVFIILRNAAEIDRNKKLYYQLKFSMI